MRHLSKEIVLGIFLGTAAFVSVEAQQSVCGPRDNVMDDLGRRFGETLHGIGTAPGGIVEWFANPATGTWTITVTTPQGMTCFVATGQNFEAVPQGIKG